MNLLPDVLQVLDGVLGLQGRSLGFDRNTPLLGALPELDSMAVVTLITALESRFNLVIDDEDIDGTAFASAGTLADWVGRMRVA